MSVLNDQKNRREMLNRLKRAEGQLRGVQRMIDEGEPCLDIAGQLSAVRRALDSAYARMTVCFLEQELHSTFNVDPGMRIQVNGVLKSVEGLLAKGH